MATHNIGIDLGTSNTIIHKFYYNPGLELDSAPIPVTIKYPDENHYPIYTKSILPSIMLLEENPTEAGSYKIFPGEVALQMIADKPSYAGRLLWNTKRLMGRDDNFEDNTLTPQMVATEFFKVCFYSVYTGLSSLYRQFCITRPAASDPYKIASTNEAAALAIKAVSKAGMDSEECSIDIIEEPQAALLSFLYDRIQNPKYESELLDKQRAKADGCLRIAVVDIGGGTTDVIVQNVQITGSHGRKVRNVYVGGEEYFTDYVVNFKNMRGADGKGSSTNSYQDFGGMDFDYTAAFHLVEKLKSALREKGYDYDNFSEEFQRCLSNLAMQNAQEYKESGCRFSVYEWSPGLFGIVNIPNQFTIQYTREEYYKWVWPLCGASDIQQRTNDFGNALPTVYSLIHGTLQDSGYSVSDLDYMYVTGGMSQFPLVAEMIRKEFGTKTELIFSRQPLYDISRGAALRNTFFRVERDIYTVPASIMMDIPSGEPIVLVKKGEKLPIPKRSIPGFTIINPFEFTIQIFRGSGPLGHDLQRVQTTKILLHKLTAVGTPVEVNYTFSEEEDLSMEIIVKDNPPYAMKVEMTGKKGEAS